MLVELYVRHAYAYWRRWILALAFTRCTEERLQACRRSSGYGQCEDDNSHGMILRGVYARSGVESIMGHERDEEHGSRG